MWSGERAERARDGQGKCDRVAQQDKMRWLEQDMYKSDRMGSDRQESHPLPAGNGQEGDQDRHCAFLATSSQLNQLPSLPGVKVRHTEKGQTSRQETVSEEP